MLNGKQNYRIPWSVDIKNLTKLFRLSCAAWICPSVCRTVTWLLSCRDWVENVCWKPTDSCIPFIMQSLMCERKVTICRGLETWLKHNKLEVATVAQLEPKHCRTKKSSVNNLILKHAVVIINIHQSYNCTYILVSLESLKQHGFA